MLHKRVTMNRLWDQNHLAMIIPMMPVRIPTGPCKYSGHVSGAMAVGVGYSVHGVLQATDGREAA